MATPNQLTPSIDKRGYVTYLRMRPDYLDNCVFDTASVKTLTIPPTACMVVFSANGDFWVNPRNGGSAAVPGADITDGSGCELNPLGYSYLVPGETISIAVAVATKMSVSWHCA